MNALRLLHIADVHLDAPFRWLGSRGKEQRRQLRETFRSVIDLAGKERADALLVAGDLFDSNCPSQDTIDLVQTELRRLNTPVFLLPGTHDCLEDASVYRKLDLSSAQAYIFDDSDTYFEIPSLSLTVHGRANMNKTSPTSPLVGTRKKTNTRFNVALAHGSLAMPGTEGDYPITMAEIDASEMNYVALGHWHSYRDCSTPSVKAFYSGPPELLEREQLGCPLLVTLGESGTVVEPRPVGRRRFNRIEIALDRVQSQEEIRERLLKLSDEDLVLSVALTGIRRLGLVVNLEELTHQLATNFFALGINDGSHPTVSPEDLEGLPANLVIGEFVRRMNFLIAGAAGPEDRRIFESALQIGVALLQGKRVLQ